MNDYAEPRNLGPIFQGFVAGQVNCPADSEADFVGSVWRHEFYCELRNKPAQAVRPNLPAIDDELFEWITLRDAIRAARGSFTFMEVGAGLVGKRPTPYALLAAMALQRSKPSWWRVIRRIADGRCSTWRTTVFRRSNSN
jgi:hypothetical protein